MTEFFSSIGNSFNVLYNTISWVDLLDVALVAYVIYQVISLVRQTRAASLARGIVVLLVGYFLSIQLGLKTMKFLLDTVLQFGLILLVVVFQPELRSALEKVGRKSFGRFSFLTSKISSEEKARWNDAIVRICDSAEKMSRTRTGALIVIERTTALGDTLSTGTAMDCIVTSEALETIFYEGSPLHDGAVVIRDARIAAAGCLLPISQNSTISKDMGTRHRAAIGISEGSDAVTVVVSEETGIISIAQNGMILRKLDRPNIYRILTNEIIPDNINSQSDKSLFGRIFKNEKK